jgi:hypothetical protein
LTSWSSSPFFLTPSTTSLIPSSTSSPSAIPWHPDGVVVMWWLLLPPRRQSDGVCDRNPGVDFVCNPTAGWANLSPDPSNMPCDLVIGHWSWSTRHALVVVVFLVSF